MQHNSKLAEWLNYENSIRAMEAMGVTKQAVSYWRLGVHLPTPHHARMLIKLSDGFLCWGDIYPLRADQISGEIAKEQLSIFEYHEKDLEE
jgi:hypothetical protein